MTEECEQVWVDDDWSHECLQDAGHQEPHHCWICGEDW